LKLPINSLFLASTLRTAAFFELITLPTKVAELTVAVGSGTGGNVLAIGAQGIFHLPQ
jgi:hypothetical protein